MSIVPSSTKNDKEMSNLIESFFARFQLAKIATKINLRKTKGVPVFVLLSYLISTIFANQSFYRDYCLKRDQLAFSDKTARNLLNNGKMNWQRLLILLSSEVIKFIRPLTSKDRREAFIIDDSMYERLNGKKVELCAWQTDHADGNRKKRGFRFLQLGWTDGNTFLPVAFSLLASSNIVKPADSTDKRTLSGQRKILAQTKATDVVIELLKAALKDGVTAKYVLFDSWFSSPRMFHNLKQLGLSAVCMVKKSSKVHYHFQGEKRDVKEIYASQKKRRGRSRYLLSVEVEATVDEEVTPIKLVFIRNRNKRKDYLVLASMDTSLTEEEIIQLYGKRWAIEVYFKMCKQHLRLAKYQGLAYDGIYAHTVTVAISYLILAVQHREQTDDRTIGELFFYAVQELQDLTFVEAIQYLLELFEAVFEKETSLDSETVTGVLHSFLLKLPIAVQSSLKI